MKFLEKKSGAKRPREAAENSPVAVKIKTKTLDKTSGPKRLNSSSRYEATCLAGLKLDKKSMCVGQYDDFDFMSWNYMTQHCQFYHLMILTNEIFFSLTLFSKLHNIE